MTLDKYVTCQCVLSSLQMGPLVSVSWEPAGRGRECSHRPQYGPNPHQLLEPSSSSQKPALLASPSELADSCQMRLSDSQEAAQLVSGSARPAQGSLLPGRGWMNWHMGPYSCFGQAAPPPPGASQMLDSDADGSRSWALASPTSESPLVQSPGRSSKWPTHEAEDDL